MKNLLEKLKAILEQEIKWEERKRRYVIALEGGNRKSHIRAANRQIEKAREKYRKIVNG